MQDEEDDDFALALQLQELWEAEAAAGVEAPPDPASLRPLSVVDEAWELLDPSPDVHGLFVQFNEALFWGRLAAVEVSWSPRMTLYGPGVECGGRRGWEPPGAAAGVLPPPHLVGGSSGSRRGVELRCVNSQLISRVVRAPRIHCFVPGSLSAALECVNTKGTVGCVLFV